MRSIKLMTDYGCFPLWHANGEVGNIDPETLGISEKLKERLRNWADIYDATLNWDDPLDSPGFLTIEDEIKWKQEGFKIYQELQNELGSEFIVLTHSEDVLPH